jgi:(E)-4-hydroxy-3-methylbut-2-enyl-diphosphate synthase
VRIAVPDMESAKTISSIKESIDVPLIADIHFDHRLAIAAIRSGADGIRINPGNIGGVKALEKIAKEALTYRVAIRVGVNAGSISRRIREKFGHPVPEALVESAIKHIRALEEMGFTQIKVSVKSSNVLDTIRSYELLAKETDYPFHIGITEAGTLIAGTVKNSIGTGILLYKGLGDTIRVSLTGDPIQEVRVAYEILRALGIRRRGPEIVSCPTCGRCEIDLPALVERVEKEICNMIESPKVAIMGCVVNGPGEAREADVGIAGGRGKGILFKKGRIVKKVPEHELADVLIKEVKRMS